MRLDETLEHLRHRRGGRVDELRGCHDKWSISLFSLFCKQRYIWVTSTLLTTDGSPAVLMRPVCARASEAGRRVGRERKG